MNARMSPLHKRLVALQSDGELARKATKAKRRGTWTVEENDLIVRKAIRRRNRQCFDSAQQGSLNV